MTHTYIITYTIEMYQEALKLLPYLSCFFCPPILLCLFYMYLMDALSLFVVLFYPPPPHRKKTPFSRVKRRSYTNSWFYDYKIISHKSQYHEFISLRSHSKICHIQYTISVLYLWTVHSIEPLQVTVI